MIWTDCINIFLSVVTSILTIVTTMLTYAMFKLNKTMTKIAEDDKKEKTGHDLNIVLPTLSINTRENSCVLNNFCIVNNKNRMEAVYRIYIKEKEGDEINFWLANNEPIMIPPYGCYYISKNVPTFPSILSVSQVKIYAVINDSTIELSKNINCFFKPLDKIEN